MIESLPTFVTMHALWSVLLFFAFGAVYRKYKETELEMLEYFYKYFLAFSVPFFGLMTLMTGIGSVYESELIRSLGYTIPHLFAFVTLGYLWKVQTTINFPEYQKFFWAFVAFGVFIALFGVWEMPAVPLENGEFAQGLGPGSTFSMILPIAYAISAVLIGGSSLYSAYLTSGETRIKLAIIGIGTLLAFIVSGTLQNMGYNALGDVFNLTWILMFLSVAYWGELKGIKNKIL